MIDINHTIALIQELIGIPSESSGQTQTDATAPELALVNRLANLCASMDIEHQIQEVVPGRPNFIARFPNPEKPKLLIVAHLDTVSASGMSDPFAGQIKEEKIWGRGACDDKGPLATALSTLIQLRTQRDVWRYDVTFAATIDEECSLRGAAALREGVGSWDLCLCLEPTSLKLVKAHKGVYRCRVTSHGKAVHSSTPDLGINAILGMVEIIDDLQLFACRLSRRKHPELGRASLAVTQIKGGVSVNIIPDHCEISVDVRLLPEHHPQKIARAIQQVVGNRGAVENLFFARGVQTEIDNPLIRQFQEALRKAGHSDEAGNAGYATDCSELQDNGPCIIWGPGHITQAHQVDEHIELNQVSAASEVLASFLKGN
ncbi:MAG: M20 family metallopeptidase [Proteobacteria bacterium]|nr:M20 family metallopeptidase [Pseudomonadota bacterium]